MSTAVTYVANQYNVPAYQDTGYAQGTGNLSSYLIALATGSLTLSGGTFTLTADADFGANFGLKSIYYKSRATNPSSAGIMRLGNTETFGWRDNANANNILIACNATQTGGATYTIPDTGQTTANFVMTQGAQTIAGAKTFSSAVLFADGAVGAPGLSFSADTDTGIRRSGANTGTLVANGADTLVWNASQVSVALGGNATTPGLVVGSTTNSGIRASGTTLALVSNGADNLIWDNATLTAKLVVSCISGSVSTPSFNLGDTGTGLYRTAANKVGVTLNGVKAAEFATTGTADDLIYVPLALSGGGGSNTYEFTTFSTTGVTTAKQIASPDVDAQLFLVLGSDGAGNRFVDVIVGTFDNTTPSVILTKTSAGAPAARTYSGAANNVKVAMASGTYTIRTVGFGGIFR